MYSFSEMAEELLSKTRTQLSSRFGGSPAQYIFTSGTTESINLVANHFQGLANSNHSILVTQLEHHANLLPWMRLAKTTGAKLNILPLKTDGAPDLEKLDTYLSQNCLLFAVSHESNLTGLKLPLNNMIQRARDYGVSTLVDGAQAVSGSKPQFTELDCDFYAFSGHKLYSPAGIGALYCREPEKLTPLKLGGGIVNRVQADLTNSNYQLVEDISRFEAGSPNMPGIAGLSACLSFLARINLEEEVCRQKQLIQKALSHTRSLGFTVISDPESHHILSFTSNQFHSHDIASILASENISVRAGHHCAQPYLKALGHKHCVRVSLGLYNDEEDISRLQHGLSQVISILG